MPTPVVHTPRKGAARMWSSVHAKGYTLVIVVTIFLAVWNDGHHTKSKIVGETRTAQLVQCQPQALPGRVGGDQHRHDIDRPLPRRRDDGNGSGHGHGNDAT